MVNHAWPRNRIGGCDGRGETQAQLICEAGSSLSIAATYPFNIIVSILLHSGVAAAYIGA